MKPPTYPHKPSEPPKPQRSRSLSQYFSLENLAEWANELPLSQVLSRLEKLAPLNQIMVVRHYEGHYYFRYAREAPNTQFKSELRAYKKLQTKYLKDLAAYPAALAQYEADSKAYAAWNTKRQIRSLQAEIRTLKSKVSKP